MLTSFMYPVGQTIMYQEPIHEHVITFGIGGISNWFGRMLASWRGLWVKRVLEEVGVK